MSWKAPVRFFGALVVVAALLLTGSNANQAGSIPPGQADRCANDAGW